jgi:hypothetical protein
MESAVANYRKKLRDQLAKAERNVAEGEARIARRREHLEQLERVNAIAEGARDALRQFEQLQKLHVADRDRLLKELRLWEGAGSDESVPTEESPPTSPT